MLIREQTENWEILNLSEFAAKSRLSRGREYEEENVKCALVSTGPTGLSILKHFEGLNPNASFYRPKEIIFTRLNHT